MGESSPLALRPRKIPPCRCLHAPGKTSGNSGSHVPPTPVRGQGTPARWGLRPPSPFLCKQQARASQPRGLEMNCACRTPPGTLPRTGFCGVSREIWRRTHLSPAQRTLTWRGGCCAWADALPINSRNARPPNRWRTSPSRQRGAPGGGCRRPARWSPRNSDARGRAQQGPTCVSTGRPAPLLEGGDASAAGIPPSAPTPCARN